MKESILQLHLLGGPLVFWGAKTENQFDRVFASNGLAFSVSGFPQRRKEYYKVLDGETTTLRAASSLCSHLSCRRTVHSCKEQH